MTNASLQSLATEVITYIAEHPERESDFGTFGIISRMNDEFKVMKRLFNNRKRVRTNVEIRAHLRNIAADALLALAAEKGPEK